MTRLPVQSTAENVQPEISGYFHVTLIGKFSKTCMYTELKKQPRSTYQFSIKDYHAEIALKCKSHMFLSCQMRLPDQELTSSERTSASSAAAGGLGFKINTLADLPNI